MTSWRASCAPLIRPTAMPCGRGGRRCCASSGRARVRPCPATPRPRCSASRCPVAGTSSASAARRCSGPRCSPRAVTTTTALAARRRAATRRRRPRWAAPTTAAVDLVLLRTATSLELLAVATYETAAGSGLVTTPAVAERGDVVPRPARRTRPAAPGRDGGRRWRPVRRGQRLHQGERRRPRASPD